MKKYLYKIMFSIVIILIMIYLLGIIFYENRYFPNTYINDNIISNKTERTIEEQLLNKAKNYNLTIKAKDLPSETIYGEEFDYLAEIDTDFYNILKSQNKYLWPLYSLFKKEYTINLNYKFDENKLKERLKRTNCITNENQKAAENATIKKDKSGFRIIPEKEGTIVNFDSFFSKSLEYVKNFTSIIDIEKENLYEQPLITKDSEEIQKELELYKACSNFTITYNFGSKHETVDFKVYGNWITLNEYGDMIVDTEPIKEFVKSLASKYDTLGDNILFSTTNSGNQAIKSVTYGWKINVDETVNQLKELLENKETISVEPIYTKKAISREENIIGDTYIEISLSEQRLWFYKDGECLVNTPVVTGLPTEDRETKTGIYFLVSREKERNLGTYEVQGYSSFVNYWLPFNGGQGVHDSTWREDYEYGGNTYLTNGSHGCVNTPLDKVEIIYENIQTGFPVIVY